MNHRLLYIPILILFLFSFTDCAKKGSPSGGKKDSIPPVIVRSVPENYTTNFKGDEIKIYFDEYIKLNELQKNLIISPPLQNQPIITPLSTSKILRIKLLDTLRDNTTYSINFGKSIVDNNEGNELKYFKYVFSTGNYIDSLKLSGTIKDALLPNVERPTTVMLYELNEEYSDSIIFSKKPIYIATTKDSTDNFELTNLKAGTYRLIALRDSNSDYIYQQTLDKIGYISKPVTIPTDTTYSLSLFQEEPSYKIKSPKHITKYSILFDYQGTDSIPILNLISDVPDNYQSITFKDLKQDSLYYFFKPELTLDSLLFEIESLNQREIVTAKIRNLFADSLKIETTQPTTLKLKDSFRLKVNRPVTALDSSKFKITDKDTLEVDFDLIFEKPTNTLVVAFDKKEDQKYTIELFPEAVTDFYNSVNDSLRFGVRTKLISDYGTLSLTIQNIPQNPLIVQLVDNKFNLISEEVLTAGNEVYIDEINPGSYYLRVVLDENKNGKWDTGNFLENVTAERVIYYPSQLQVKANWSLNETFILSETYLDPLKIEAAPED